MDEFEKIRELSEGLAQSEISQEKIDPSVSQKPEKGEGSSETPDEIFASFSATSLRFDDLEDKLSSGGLKLHFLVGGIFIGVLAAVITGVLLFGTDAQDEEKIMTITATATPVKVKPEQPGGMVIPDQDKLVYNRIRTDALPTKVEKLFPEPEKPVLPRLVEIEKNTPPETFVSADAADGVNPLDEMPPVTPEVVDVTPPEVIPVPPEVRPVDSADAAAPKKEIIQIKVEENPAPQVKNPIKEPIKKASSDMGEWKVQLFSSSKKASVEKAWPRILAKNKALLSDMPYVITEAQIAGKGTFYRLHVGKFKTKDQAAAFCKKLKANKQDCVTAK